MTRLEAIRAIRSGGRLIKTFHPDWYGVELPLEVHLSHRDWCDFPHEHTWGHEVHGPVHVLFVSPGRGRYIHASVKQLRSFIKRNYPRK